MTDSISRLARRALLGLGLGRIKLVKDDGPVQMVQASLSDDELIDLPRLTDFGFSSNPPIDSHILASFIAGVRAQGVVTSTGHPESRPKDLKPGESILYNFAGVKVYLSLHGLHVDGAGLPITISNCPRCTITASDEIILDTKTVRATHAIIAGGDITDNAGNGGASMASMRQTYDGHDHDVTGVQSGGSSVRSNHPNQQV